MIRRRLPAAGLLILLLAALAASAASAATAPADTVRTNLWITRALMTDLLREALEPLPADALGLVYQSRGLHEGQDLMQVALSDLLADRGMELYAPAPVTVADDEDEDEGFTGTPGVAAVPHELVVRLEDVDLEYPAAGRRLGLWRTWVDREIAVSAIVVLRDRRDGRVLLDRSLTRRYGDRIDAGRHDDVETAAYAFTEGRLTDQGIYGIVEEVVVLGALAGLVTAYFATTAD